MHNSIELIAQPLLECLALGCDETEIIQRKKNRFTMK